MKFLARLSIAKKLFLTPIIGTLSFGIYIVISTISAYENVAILDNARHIQSPAMLASVEALNSMENARELLSAAVITGDEDTPARIVLMQNVTYQTYGEGIVDIDNQDQSFVGLAVFTGKGSPPDQVGGDSDVIKMVQGDPNAIGYISRASLDDSVRAIDL